jgi:hypothetical protein
MRSRKIDRKFKRGWIGALRSGKYKQTTGALQKEDKFCCLGVACVFDGRELTPETRLAGYMPPSKAEAVNMPPKVQRVLVRLNDGMSLDQFDLNMAGLPHAKVPRRRRVEGKMEYKPLGFRAISNFIEKYL